MMENKKATRERQLAEPQGNGAATNNTDAIVTNGKPEVKFENAIQRLRVERHIPVSDMVEVVRTLYPGYDKPLHSKVDNGKKYGIRLRADAEKLLLHHFTESNQARRNDRRKKPKRIQARVSETIYGTLQRHISDAGITMQDFIEGLIFDFIEKHKEENIHD